AVTEKHESLVQSHKKKSGFLSSKTTDKLDYSLTNEVKGSTISGEAVHVTSGKDLTVKGSNVVATNDVNLQADNDVTITSTQETGADEHYKKVKKSGLFSGGGLGFTIGTQSTKTTLNEQVKDEIGSTVGSIAGNVTVTAGNNVKSEGTTVVSGKDTTITGKNVSIDNTINTYDSQYKYEFKQSGLSVSLGGAIIDAGSNFAYHVNRAGDVQDKRLQTLYGYKALQDYQIIDKNLNQYTNLQKAYDQAVKDYEAAGITQKADKAEKVAQKSDALKNYIDQAFSINIGIGSTKTTKEQNIHVETVNAANITAGGDVTIKATAGDVDLKATNITGDDITLAAAKNLTIESAQNVSQTNTKNSSSSASLGASFGLGTGSLGGFNGGVGANKSKENEDSNTHTESVISASGTTTLKSGNDTNITGSQVKGEKVVADVGGNLNIGSQQDTDTYTEKSKNSGINFDTGNRGGTHGSTNTGKINSNYSSVIEQAGIYAGKQGFTINVGKNTDLKGAVISSEATPDKNKISTDTLTYSDIKNKAEYSASSSGVNYNSTPKLGMKLGDLGLTPNIGVTASGNADSTTKSAISNGTIIVGGVKIDPINLSRDTTNSVNALGKIFDKQTVQERQELANVFGEVAYEEIHKLSEDNGWKDGDPKKVALHTIVGALMAQMGGGDALSGGVGAGVNEAMQKELSKITDPALRQWASYVVGSAAAKLAGGTPQTGGSTAASGTKNNDLGSVITGTIEIIGIGKIIVTATEIIVAGIAYRAGTAAYEWAYNKYINATFPENPDDFNPDGLVKREWNTKNGKIVKWLDPDGKAKYEWDEDADHGEHYHHTPDGKGREPHPETGDTHMYPGDTVPE
ncbi:hemagglutinin repeat-containing protein, partial [Sporomusa acidovorans]|uniref:hemagglutinin repeat-containing protein n=2 Tax=Sporomusa acidovorans TaxID=112900 RepID=UPI00087E4532